MGTKFKFKHFLLGKSHNNHIKINKFSVYLCENHCNFTKKQKLKKVAKSLYLWGFWHIWVRYFELFS